MARRPALHSADDLLAPAIERTIAAVDPPESDAALVALARIMARTVDRMTDAERAVMLGQTAPQVLRVLVELEQRARCRREPAGRPAAANPVRDMRRQHAAFMTGGKRGTG